MLTAQPRLAFFNSLLEDIMAKKAKKAAKKTAKKTAKKKKK
jgi:hypothetical protein